MPRSRNKSQRALHPRLQTYLRAAMFLLGIIAVSGVLSYGAFIALNPFVRERQLAADNAELERRLAEQKAQVEAKEEQIDWISSPSGVLAQAKRSGMVKPDEHSVRIKIEQPKEVAAAKVREEASVSLWSTIFLASGGGLLFLGLPVSLLLLRRRALKRNKVAGVLTPRSELRRRRDRKRDPVAQH